MTDSRIPGFYKLDLAARHAELQTRYGLTDADLAVLRDGGALDWGRADKMVENCIGVMGLPVGLGLNFLINGQDVVVPMAVEEPSIIAAVSHIARLVRPHGGFQVDADAGLMIAQVQVVDVPDPVKAEAALLAARARILARANAVHPNMAARGGGARDLEVRRFGDPFPMLVVHLLADCCDAMGANAVNAMAEGIAPLVETLTGGRVCLRILSNLADRRLARAACSLPEEALAGRGFTGAEVADGVVQAWRFAAVDPYRAATHNKGVMNGIDAVAVATGNDWRGVEAGAHAWAARDGRYTSLTTWWRADGYLHGSIELPLAVGTVGGSTGVHPTIGVLRKLLGVESARELAGVMAAVGLAQNLGALKALATEGIQRGHMSLHARQVALAVGAEGELVDHVARILIERGEIKAETARLILAELDR
ncbi:MAG: hydroxymethylglutaryl-CoA reductase, degradative [Myxococcales bacterium]|nr:hydroxymethylglutaryl-CoA reductase, degradative [Myxococcales bacterium]